MQINISQQSGIYQLRSEQWLPINTEQAWRFFSNPRNLAEITPKHMGFKMTSAAASTTYVGQILTYRVGILPGIKLNWVTEITTVEEGKYFVDEQRFGPYAMWHHEHHFQPKDNGVLMTDIVSYKLPLGLLGHLAHAIFVRKQLLGIFKYRFELLTNRFQ